MTAGGNRWLAWAQRLQAISQTGLTYCKDPFDQERYTAILELAAELVAEGSSTPLPVIRDLFASQAGYATPKIDLRAAVFDERERILLVREREDGGWSLPGGWADIGSSPSENVLREVKEESGYEAEILKLAAVFDRDRHGHPPIAFYTYKLFFICKLTGGAAAASNETDSVEFFDEHSLPPLSLTRVTEDEIRLMFEHFRDPHRPTSFD